MAFPSKSDLEALDWSYNGEPFVQTTAGATGSFLGMDWAYRGEPFVMPDASGVTPPTSSIKTINGLAYASVKTINGLAKASVKTWGGLA